VLVEIKEVFCVAVRGRPKNKSYKETEQRIELGSKEICCCLTTVQKDSMLLLKLKQKENI
jgi:hypothetical protein